MTRWDTSRDGKGQEQNCCDFVLMVALLIPVSGKSKTRSMRERRGKKLSTFYATFMSEWKLNADCSRHRNNTNSLFLTHCMCLSFPVRLELTNVLMGTGDLRLLRRGKEIRTAIWGFEEQRYLNVGTAKAGQITIPEVEELV